MDSMLADYVQILLCNLEQYSLLLIHLYYKISVEEWTIYLPKKHYNQEFMLIL